MMIYIYDNIFSYYIWLALIYLVFLTWKDVKNNMVVDDRMNYFLYGVAASLISHIPRGFWYLLALTGTTILFNFVMNKLKVVGEADINSLSWIIYGLGIIGVATLFWFFIWFVMLTLIYWFLSAVVFKKFVHGPVPFYPVILGSFLLNAVMLGLF